MSCLRAFAGSCLLVSVLAGCNTAPVISTVAAPHAQRPNRILLRSTDVYDGVFVAALSNQGFIVQPITEATDAVTHADAASAEPHKDTGKDTSKSADKSGSSDKDGKSANQQHDNVADKTKAATAASTTDAKNACVTNGNVESLLDRCVASATKTQMHAFREAGFYYVLQLSITHDDRTTCMLSDGHRVSVVMSVTDIDTHKPVMVLKQVGLDRACPPQGAVWEPLAQQFREAWN